jgi:hypothetical protein
MKFWFGEPGENRVEVDVIDWKGNPEGGYWDGVLLLARIEASALGFQGATNAEIKTNELSLFLEELQMLHKIGGGRAELRTAAGQVRIVLSSDHLAYLDVETELTAGPYNEEPGEGRPDYCARLHFWVSISLGQLRTQIGHIEQIMSRCPVKRH